jgi:hypothetical protein
MAREDQRLLQVGRFRHCHAVCGASCGLAAGSRGPIRPGAHLPPCAGARAGRRLKSGDGCRQTAGLGRLAKGRETACRSRTGFLAPLPAQCHAQRRARDSNPQPLSGHHISSVAALRPERSQQNQQSPVGQPGLIAGARASRAPMGGPRWSRGRRTNGSAAAVAAPRDLVQEAGELGLVALEVKFYEHRGHRHPGHHQHQQPCRFAAGCYCAGRHCPAGTGRPKPSPANAGLPRLRSQPDI